MSKTLIAWTEKVWNPTRGCSKVSDGCKNCYAERMAARFSGKGQPYEGLVTLPYFTTRTVEYRDMDGNYTGQDDCDVKVASRWTGEARFIPEMLDAPLRWKKPSLIFVNSMSDLFHNDITDEQIAETLAVVAYCERHTFQILTKRPERMLDVLGRVVTERVAKHGASAGQRLPDCVWAKERVWQIVQSRYDAGRVHSWHWPLTNLHLGVSVENQSAVDERIPLLLQCPAAVRWVSCEPLLGQIDFSQVPTPLRDSVRIDWVVTGGESGPNARPMHPDWARSLRDQCKAANVPYFFKQHGEWSEDDNGDRCVMRNGQNLPNLEPNGNNGYGACRISRVGKKRAGNLLDGVRYEMRPGDKW